MTVHSVQPHTARNGNGEVFVETSNVQVVLSSYRNRWSIGCGCVLLLFFVFASSEKVPFSANREATLATYLDDPIIIEIPVDVAVTLRPKVPPAAEVVWDVSSDYGATFRHFQVGQELRITAADVATAGAYLRPSWRRSDGVLVPAIPYLLVEDAKPEE